MRLKRRLLDIPLAFALFFALLTLAGCAVTPREQAAFDDSKAFFDLIAPEYEAYVDGDETLDAKGKTTLKRSIMARRAFLRDWEKAMKEQDDAGNAGK